MHKFLSENNSDEKRIFKLVKEEDLQPIMGAFDGVKVKTLVGNCTRSLHQIKPSEKKGFLMQRPFSCFCTYCLTDDFTNCCNKGFTKGTFTKHKLPSNDIFDVEEIDEEDENDDIEINSDVFFNENEDTEDEIEIIEQSYQIQY